jgi:hypothetical protein
LRGEAFRPWGGRGVGAQGLPADAISAVIAP